MKSDLLEYLDEEKPAAKEDEAKEESEGSLKDMKVKLLAMKYEQTHDPEKRVPALIALVRCIVDSTAATEAE